MIKKAVILAAGRGERLDRPGTPKPLVDVGGQPIVVRLIRQLEKRGITDVALVIGYEGRKIKRIVSGHIDLKARLHFIENTAWEDGQLSSVLAADAFVDEPFVLAMADHVFDDQLLEPFLDPANQQEGITVLADGRIDQISAIESAVKIHTKGDRAELFGRSLGDFNGVDTGLFIADTALMTYGQQAVAAGHNELLEALNLAAKDGAVHTHYIEEGAWSDVDTPADLVHAEMRLRRQLRESRVPKDVVQFAAQAPEAYPFYTGSQQRTDMIVGRGFIANPTTIPLIPGQSTSSPIFVFTDDVVEELYGREFKAKLKRLGYDVTGIVLPEGEESKSLANYIYLVERVLSRGVDERSVFISLGGGVV